ncbi:hypothetical protein OOT33_04935 [Sphingobium sp. DEHP117]|uniref:hypothetical protein n=1 Tax=Sphingobium sp. DEHP117 TaxID=2993436 RepID=UPI0027D4BFA7|nr:hypothetical protein [Sphingobium sp. DEHP117]MDQ4419786.1 hypothetical protein [Sphingobium sp. DEHP117]
MAGQTLNDALDRLDRAVAGAETALLRQHADVQTRVAQKDAAMRQAVGELDALIASLGGGRDG